MAPKSKAETTSKGAEKKEKVEKKEKAPGSRRSGRLAGSEPEKVDEGVKAGTKVCPPLSAVT